MNKKKAIAYAQITLDYIQSPKYTSKITPKNLGIKMKQAFKLYTKDIATIIAHSMIETKNKLKTSWKINHKIYVCKYNSLRGVSMEQVSTKNTKTEYKIIPLFSNDGKKIDIIIENAFLKYLKYNDYK